MNFPLALALILFPASAFCDSAAAAAQWPSPAAAEAAKPAAELTRLEKILAQKQAEKRRGLLTPGRYLEFAAEFRAALDAAMARVAPTPANQGLHSRLLSLLGEPGRALTDLDQALERDPKNTILLRAKGEIFFEQGNFPAAAESARQAWESSDHTDKEALEILKMSERRTAPSAAITPKDFPQPQSASAAVAGGPNRPSAPAVKAGRGVGPPARRVDKEAPPSPGSLAYIGAPSDAKPGLWPTVDGFVRSEWSLFTHRPTRSEASRLDELHAIIASTPSGKRLISEMGGWKKIESDVVMKFGPTSPGALAQAQALGSLGQGYFHKKFALIMGPESLTAPPEASAVSLAHELSHVKDGEEGHLKRGLQIPSEYGAFRRENYVYEDIRKAATPERRAVLEKNPHWQWLMFSADLWEDHITQRYTLSQFMSRYNSGRVKYMASDAYLDAKLKKVAPGSAQLDYHIFADPKKGIYRVRSNETDVLELPPEERTPELLAAREGMIKAQEAVDRDYRKRNGLEIWP